MASETTLFSRYGRACNLALNIRSFVSYFLLSFSSAFFGFSFSAFAFQTMDNLGLCFFGSRKVAQGL